MAAKGTKRSAKPAVKAASRAATKPKMAKRVAEARTPRPATDRTGSAQDQPAKPTRTMPVHALADDRVHLAVEHRGRLKQGRLKTLCGLQAVSALSPFVLADKAQKRCKNCFGRVDEDGLLAG